ncbi:MAG: dipeptidase [Anaerolineaceae bacterium]|nr:dipeptidase [Anaerolineaceae bacterium]
MSAQISPEVQELHEQIIIIDGHCDTLLNIQAGLLDFGKGFTPTEESKNESRGEISHIDLARMQAGGITTQVFASFVEMRYLPSDATNQALRLFDHFYKTLEENAAQFDQVTNAAEIEATKKNGKVSGMLSLEGVESLEGDLAILRNFHRLGIRQVGLTWNWRNQAADGLFEARTGGGLTEFGVELVKECNRLGIILDIAHLSPPGVRDIFELSEQPIVDSHCGAGGVTNHMRNLSDEQLDRMAKNGGVVCVTFVPNFINEDGDKATIEDVLNHIDYISKRIGVDHVGIGSDFDGFGGYLPGVEDASKMPMLTAGLIKRGYSPEDTTKVMGGNYLRVIREVCG